MIAGTPGANWPESLITTQSQASRSRFCCDERLEVLAADFLFAFDEELHLQRQLARRDLSQASTLFTCVSIWPLSSVAPRA